MTSKPFIWGKDEDGNPVRVFTEGLEEARTWTEADLAGTGVDPLDIDVVTISRQPADESESPR